MDIERRGTRSQFLGTPISRGWESEEEPTKETGKSKRLPARKEETR